MRKRFPVVSMTDGEPTPEACDHEIRALHSFFVDWYTDDGALGDTDFDRFEDALASSFETVTPEGDVLTRDGIVDYVYGKHGTHADGGFDIEIRNVEAVDVRAGRILMRYEEWQTVDDETNGRVSTALFGPSESAPEGVEWLHLQETCL